MESEQRAFLAISNAALSTGVLPALIPLLAFGDNATDRGVLRITDRSIAALKKQREDGFLDRVLVDFEHNSVRTSPTYQPPPRHHAGAGMVACDKDGLRLENMQWTPKGDEYAANYPDISPCVSYDKKTKEVLALHSVGLVPNGGVIGLSFFSVTEPKIGDDMAENNELTELKDQIAALSTLKDQVAGLTTQLNELKEKLDKLTAPPEDIEAIDLAAKLKPVEDKISTLRADFAAETAKRDKKELLTMASFQGKVVSLSDDAIAKLSVDDLAAHIDKIDSTVPMEKRTFAATPKASTEGLTVVEQYNAISDPAERATFWRENRDKLVK